MIQRQAVRALLLTEDRHLLLIKIVSPVRDLEMWMTPGGGIEADESDLQALQREVREETGLEKFEPGSLVWTRNISFPWREGMLHQHEKFFLIRVRQFEASMHLNPAAGEKEIFRRFHWWPLDELLASSEIFAPPDLGRQLTELLRQTEPGIPQDISSRSE